MWKYSTKLSVMTVTLQKLFMQVPSTIGNLRSLRTLIIKVIFFFDIPCRVVCLYLACGLIDSIR